MDKLKPVLCGCGSLPEIHPLDPGAEGNAWAAVCCVNPDCPARPEINDGEDSADDRGSLAYKKLAVARWNKFFATHSASGGLDAAVNLIEERSRLYDALYRKFKYTEDLAVHSELRQLPDKLRALATPQADSEKDTE